MVLDSKLFVYKTDNGIAVMGIEEAQKDLIRKIPLYATSLIAVGITFFHLYTGARGTFDYLIQRPVHLLSLTALSFAVYPLKKEGGKIRIIDSILIIMSFSTLAYILVEHGRLLNTVAYVTKPQPLDWVFMIIALVVVLEAARRVVGFVLPLLGLIFLVTGYLLATMQLFPSLHVPKILDFWWVHAMFITSQGLWGVPTMVSATFIFLFVTFAAFLEATRVGRFMIDFSMALVGKTTGGPGKVAVIASSMFGTISGSAAANVYATGIFTIPTMKRFGFDKNFAGAVEVVASTGGQLMPPIMGAGAFVMAEFLGIPYIRIAAAAVLPAIIYYFSAFFAVHAEALKRNLRGLPPEEIKPMRRVLYEELGQALSFIIPIGALIYFLVKGISLYTAVFYSIIILLIVSMFRKESRLTPRTFYNAMENAAKNAIMIALACGVASIIVGVLNVTGWSVTLAQFLVGIAHGNIYILLVSAALFSILLGFGMPTTAAYILAASLVAPALIMSGFQDLPAHFYVYTFAIYSTITPPVALASYAAASISKGDPIKIALTAMKMVVPSFLIPVRFVINPTILLYGTPADIALEFFMLMVATMSVESGLFGWPLESKLVRTLLVIGGAIIIFPFSTQLPFLGNYVNYIAFVLIVLLFFVSLFKKYGNR